MAMGRPPTPKISSVVSVAVLVVTGAGAMGVARDAWREASV